jgi:hypothetical protein
MRRKTYRATILMLSATCLLALAVGVFTLQSIAQAPQGDGYFPIIMRDTSGALTAADTPAAPAASIYQIDGHPVPETVYAYYQQVGADVAGPAMSGYTLNEETGRFEMIFRNMGIYVDPEDPSQEVHPMPLGMVYYYNKPGPTPQPGLNIPLSPLILEMFDAEAAALGQEITGSQLVSLAIDPNGYATRLFENVVLKIDPENPDQVSLLPVPELVGMPVNPPVPQINDPRYIFVKTAGELGHNVPQDFWEFIRSHTTIDITGDPQTEIFYPPGTQDMIRQCFRYMCLDYNMATGEIAVANLGLDYYRQYHARLADISTPFSVSLNVWEAQPSIPPDEPQVITVKITQNNLPVINLQPLLEVTLPNQDRQTYQMPPTGLEGDTSIQIPPVQAANGTIIPYQVCVIFADASRYCVSDQFLIWNIP